MIAPSGGASAPKAALETVPWAVPAAIFLAAAIFHCAPALLKGGTA
mgnify:CR=1 FL=1